MAKVEIAERTGKRQVPVVGALLPRGRTELEPGKGAIDLALLALLPRLMPLFLRPKALFIDEQQGGIEDAVAEGAKGQGFEARRALLREQHGSGGQAVEIFADDVAVVDCKLAHHKRRHLSERIGSVDFGVI